MKKGYVVFYSFVFLLMVMILTLTGCGGLRWRMDGIVPFGYFKAQKKENERLVLISPTLAPNHWFSNVYVITNPEDIQKAQDKFGNLGKTASLTNIEKELKEFSPIKVQSTSDSPVGLSHPIGDGIAIFRLPESTCRIFYLYIRFIRGIKYSSDYTTEVVSGIVELLPGSEDVLIQFSERKNVMGLSVYTNPKEVKAYFDLINYRIGEHPTQYTGGFYGWYLSKQKTQAGFIDIGFKQRWEIVNITPPPRNIAAPEIRERYTIPVKATLIGDYAKYNVITERNIVGKSQSWQLSKSQILDWIDLNKNNQDFCNALAICTIIADIYEYDIREFLCVDYCAMFIGIDAEANESRLESKIVLVMDDNHIWMRINVPNRYRDTDGIVKNADYLWVDPTWFDNGNVYNFNNFTWGGQYVPQFMEGVSGAGDQCHKLIKAILGQKGKDPVVPGMTYSVVYDGNRYICVKDDFGRRQR